MTEYSDTMGKPVRVTVAPDGTTMFLDTVVGVDMNGKPITVSSLNDITGAALRERQVFFEQVCDALSTLNAVSAELESQGELPTELYRPLREFCEVVWPEPRQEEKPAPVMSEDGMHAESQHMQQTRNNAYTLGKIAGDALKSAGAPSANPYDGKNTELAGIWQRGYLDGQKEAQ